MKRQIRQALPYLMLCALLAGCGGDDALTAPAGGEPGAAAPQGLWLKGDLHLHSYHSTDALDNPMAVIVREAESRGMDYFVVTDHDNHVEGHLTTWDDPDYRSEQMVLLYGVEFTSAKGHAILLGADRWDHPAVYAHRDGAGADLGAEIRRQGLHFSPAHPTNANPWLYGYDIGIDSLEVWNALYKFPSDNADNVNLWDRLMLSGMRVPARGGSDCHHQQGIEPLGLNIGTPTTWVYAAERSGPAILDALAAGRASISYAPGGERVALWADTDGDGVYETLMGDNVVPSGGPVRFKVEIEGFRLLAGYEVVLLRDGRALQSQRPGSGTVFFEDTPPADRRSFYRVEVNGSTPEAETLPAALIGFYGRKIALTNPIHFGF